MSWNYSVDQASPKDRVRFVIGDTDNDRQLISDEEIVAVLIRQNSNITRAAIEICEHLEAKFVRRAESRSGEIIADFLTVAGKYRELAARLRKRGLKGYWLSTPDARTSDKDDTSKVHPNISVNEFDDPET